ncbi:alpha-glucoside transport system permease protein [Geodermatophilus obscurus]|uniref:Alpha-glucoside transport system permease protein n=1 Tax=Geodermatophilus obscurus TaxID=1861 RepID=A0A1I5FYW1_9ACTN|nr:sugar ABC transporter permease [Geodermatophilus obscurus]SFO28836.1 alpha-glucoside transport system permease protein [Geodermatophilus obscurus]
MQWFLEATTTGHKIALMVFAILLFAAVMAAILFAVDRPKRVPNWIVAVGFVGPTLLLLAVGLVYPALETVRGSFYNRDGSSFVGLDNYVTVFSEDNFQTVLFNTLLWVVLVPLVTTGLGLVYAYLVDRTRFEKLAKALVFLPMAISMVGAGVIWKFVYEYRPDQPGVRQIGLLNQVLVLLGFEPQQFLLNAPSNSFYLIVVMIWIQAGFAMTVLSAAIKAIPDDVVEAARLDGVGGLQMFRYVTVPSIRPALVVVVTTVAITTLKVFDIVRTMTGGQFSTSVVANEFYVQAFRQFNFGLGAALAVLLFLLVIPIIAYNVRQLRLAEELR